MGPARWGQCSWRPCLITAPHLSSSESTTVTSSAGELPIGSVPPVFSCVWMSGIAMAAFTSRLTLSTIAWGVPFGATSPYQSIS